MVFRVKCRNCGNVQDVLGDDACKQCRAPIASKSDGMIQMYRMGSPFGVAAGYGIYINGEPYGHIANTQSIRIPLPFGSYKLHCTCGATRSCNDLVVNVTPEFPNAYVKARLCTGFWTNHIAIEPASPESMPKD